MNHYRKTFLMTLNIFDVVSESEYNHYKYRLNLKICITKVFSNLEMKEKAECK